MTDKELVENNKHQIKETAVDENDFETIEYLFDNYNLTFSYRETIKYLGKNNQIIKKYFKEDNYNRKEMKRILISCYDNLVMTKYFVGECGIIPTLSFYLKAYRNISLIKNSKEVYEYLINHKILSHIYLKYKEEINDLSKEYDTFKKDIDKILRNKKIKNLIL